MNKKILNGFLVFFTAVAILAFSLSRLDYTFKWATVFVYKSKFIQGFIMTVVISFFSLFFSLFLGVLMALARKSKYMYFRYLSQFYIEIVRGTPFLVQIYFFYFIIATAFGLSNKYVLGIIILSLFSGAYVTEIIRGGIESINKTQLETAKSLGFTSFQTYRFIIIPQVIKRILPSLAGQLSSLVKDSSLLSVIAVSEFTMNVLEVDSLNFRTFENLTVLAVGYLLLTLPISILSKKLERKFHYEA
ncbi:amino acid ABC transporter permease [Clostridium sp. DL1XJH146]